MSPTPDPGAIAARFLRALAPLTRTTDEPVWFHRSRFDADDRARVLACLEDGRVSSAGPETAAFEAALAAYLGVRHVIATNTGTSAIMLALLVHGVGQGDEVIVPAYAYAAPANAIRHVGAVPHFVDCDPASHGLDPARVAARIADVGHSDGPRSEGVRNARTGRRIAAILPVHSHGHACDVAELAAIATTHGIPLVEDAAEALGSRRGGRALGTFGTGVLSFNGNKVLTTGGGGALLTADDAVAARARLLANAGKVPHPFEYRYGAVAHNFVMPSLNAALGTTQLARIEALVAAKRALAAAYARRFAGFEDGRLMAEPPGCRSNFWQNVLVLAPGAAPARDAILEAARAAGVPCRAGWTPLQELPDFRDCPRDGNLPVTTDLFRRSVVLPSDPALAARFEDDAAAAP